MTGLQGRRGSCPRRHGHVHVRQHRAAPAGRPARPAQGHRAATSGTFGFAGDEVDGPLNFSRTIKTLVEDVATRRSAGHRAGPRSTTTITETLPTSNAGEWSLESVFCGSAKAADAPATAFASACRTSPVRLCTFTNRFTHAGAISISKETLDGFGTMRFQIRPTDQPGRSSTSSSRRRPSQASAWRPKVTAPTAIPLGQLHDPGDHRLGRRRRRPLARRARRLRREPDRRARPARSS